MDSEAFEFGQVASIATDAYDVNTDIEPRLRVFSEAGFRYLHWCDHWVSAHRYSDEETVRIRDLLRCYGLACTDIHSVCGVDDGRALSLGRWVELNVNRMEFIRGLGGDALVLHLPVPGLVGALTAREVAEQMMAAILPEARRLGVHLAVENGDADLIGGLFDAYRFDELAFCFDSGHSNMAGATMPFIEELSDKLTYVHITDNMGEHDDHVGFEEGTVDWDETLTAMLARGFRGPYVIEYPEEGDPGRFSRFVERLDELAE